MQRFLIILIVLSSTLLTSSAFGQTTPAAPGLGLGFGGVMSAGDGQLFVGSAPVGWPRGQEPAGSVHVYEPAADGAWVEVMQLKASDGALGDNFGRSMAFSDGLLAVGAPGAQAAYVFSKSEAGGWSQIAKLAFGDPQSDAEFAGMNGRALRTRSVAVTGAHVAVTAFEAGERTGFWIRPGPCISSGRGKLD